MAPEGEHIAVDGMVRRILYSPLETPQTIRLLQARRLSADGTIIIKLRHFSLDQGKCPGFIALSYVWGEKKLHPHEVVINGRTCQVLESIYPILALICENPVVNKDEWFWIDYLCINLDDVLEQASQVALMGELYQRAYRTLVWLGEETPDVRGALDLLKYFASGSFKHDNVEYWAAQVPEFPEQWQALKRWMERPWWTRVWTLQELLLPKSLHFYCGDQSIPRHQWYKAITAIYNYSTTTQAPDKSLIDHRGFGNQWARRRLLAWYEHSTMSLFALLAYIGHHQATDDRDRVYAMLGICGDTDRAIVGIPDYSLSVEEVYTRLVLGFMQRHRSLNILCFRALFTKPQSNLSEPGRLPTWVPDFRCWADAASRPVPSMVSEPSRVEIGNFREIRDPQHGVVDPNLVYAASAGLPAEFSVSEDNRRLTCKGIVIDTIDGLGAIRQYGQDGKLDEYLSSTIVQSTSDVNTRFQGPSLDPEQQPAGSNNTASYAVVESMVRSLTLDRAGRYLMWPADLDGYIYQLQNVLGNAYSAPQRDVRRFLGANSGLCVRNASLSQHLGEMRPPTHTADTPGERTLLQPSDITMWDAPRQAASPSSIKKWNFSVDRGHRSNTPRVYGNRAQPPNTPRQYSFWQASEITVGERPWDCRLITTDQGHLGMAPRRARKGDLVAVLIGCTVPVIIRPHNGIDVYEVVGEAFMPGFMKGEAINSNHMPHDITLI